MFNKAKTIMGISLRQLGLEFLNYDFKCPEHLSPEHVRKRGFFELLRSHTCHNFFFLCFSDTLRELLGLQSYFAHGIVDAIIIGEGSNIL